MQQKSQKQIFRQKAMDKTFTAEDLNTMMQVTKPTGWLALLVIGVIIAAVLVWSILGNLSIKVTAGGVILDNAGSGQQAVLFLPLADKENVKQGMKVQITPVGFPPQEYGYLLGNVIDVGQYPLTIQGMSDVLQNDSLVAVFSGNGLEVLVTVELQPGSNTGIYAWTLGRSAQVLSGTLLQANIIIDEKKPIELLLPS